MMRIGEIFQRLSNQPNWVCPFCGHAQTAIDGKYYRSVQYLNLSHHKYDKAGITIHSLSCANPECEEIILQVDFTRGVMTNSGTYRFHEVVSEYLLRPDSPAKLQPDFIPKAIRNDYFEACLVKDRSPKAAATLARRCIEGMLQDFCGITKGTLAGRIDHLRDQVHSGRSPTGVTVESVEAIDHVRAVGNIGAHMGADVNLIVDVDPDEAQILLDLVEMLFKEWYVARHDRQQTLAKVAAVADSLKKKRNSGAPVPTSVR